MNNGVKDQMKAKIHHGPVRFHSSFNRENLQWNDSLHTESLRNAGSEEPGPDCSVEYSCGTLPFSFTNNISHFINTVNLNLAGRSCLSNLVNWFLEDSYMKL